MAWWNLRKDWFAPNGTKYHSVNNPHEFPKSWESAPDPKPEGWNDKENPNGQIPSTAEKIPEKEVPEFKLNDDANANEAAMQPQKVPDGKPGKTRPL